MFRWLKNYYGKTRERPAGSEANKSAKSELAQLSCEMLALHKVEMSLEDIRNCFKNDKHWSVLTEDYLLELIEKLYLFDLYVSDVSLGGNIIGTITQHNGLDQVPFHEKYFDLYGTTLLFPEQTFMPQPPSDAHFPARIRFFLHYVDLNLPLVIDGREFALPAAESMPEILKSLMPYEPPN